MTSTPLVSIIIPTHNRLDLLNEAIESITQQSLQDIEVIVVDDASMPAINSKQIKDTYPLNISVIRHTSSQGGAAAKNTGAKAATGKYIAFLDDDDLYAPSYLQEAVSTLEKSPEIKTLFMGVEWFGKNAEWEKKAYKNSMDKLLKEAGGVSLENSVIKFEENKLFKALLSRIPMAFQRPVTSKEHFTKIGSYQENCLLWDCEWALRAALNGPCGLLNQGLYLQRCAGQGYSSQTNRRLDHLLSGHEIQKQLFFKNTNKELANAIKSSLIQGMQSLSWEYINQNKGGEAIKTMLKSFRYGINPLQIKFFLHALYKYISNYIKN